MPHLPDRSLVTPEDGQAGRNVWNVTVGVGELGVADEVSAFSSYGVGEDPLTKRRLGDACAEEVRRPTDCDANPTALRCGQQLGGHGRPDTPLGGRGVERKVFGHRCATGRAIAVDILQAHQKGTGALGSAQHRPLQRRKLLGPLGIRGVEALVDHRCTLGCSASSFGIAGVCGAPVDTLGQ